MFLVSTTIVALLASQSRAYLHSNSLLSPRAAADKCGQYFVSGQTDNPFQNYRFWDFRQLSNYSSAEPPSIRASQDEGDENVTSTYFVQNPFAEGWHIRRGIRNPESDVPMTYSARNAYIVRDNSSDGAQTYLGLRTTRLQEFQSMVQFESQWDNILHGSMRIRMKVLTEADDSVARGAVFGWFTYASDTQESDIEILTRDPRNMVDLTNQPASSSTPGAKSSSSLPNGKNWTEWTDYRLDWFPGVSVWYFDEHMIFRSTNSVPTDPSQMMVNLWSNGGSFSGTVRVGREVHVAIQWMEMVFNVSASNGAVDQSKPQTNTLCTVDSVATKGVPEEITISDPTQGSGPSSDAIRLTASIAVPVISIIVLHLGLAVAG